jgi:hypothetical protein
MCPYYELGSNGEQGAVYGSMAEAAAAPSTQKAVSDYQRRKTDKSLGNFLVSQLGKNKKVATGGGGGSSAGRSSSTSPPINPQPAVEQPVVAEPRQTSAPTATPQKNPFSRGPPTGYNSQGNPYWDTARGRVGYDVRTKQINFNSYAPGGTPADVERYNQNQKRAAYFSDSFVQQKNFVSSDDSVKLTPEQAKYSKSIDFPLIYSQGAQGKESNLGIFPAFGGGMIEYRAPVREIKTENVGFFGKADSFVSKFQQKNPFIIGAKTMLEYETFKNEKNNVVIHEVKGQIIGAESKIISNFEYKPVSSTIPLIVGGSAFGFGSVALSSIGTFGATSAQVVGYGLGALYVGSKVVQYSQAKETYGRGEVLGQTAMESGIFLGSASLGGKAALMAGFVPKKSAIPTFTFESTRVETLKGETKSVYNGVGYIQPSTGKGGNLFGYKIEIKPEITRMSGYSGEGEIIKGSEVGKLPFSFKQKSGFSFGTPSGLHPEYYGEGILTKLNTPGQKDIILGLEAVPKESKTEFISAYNIASQNQGVKTNVYESVVSKPRSFKTSEASDLYVKKVGDVKTWIGTRAALNYGSVWYKPQVRPSFRDWIGESGDFDAFLTKSRGFNVGFVKEISNEFNVFGEKSFVGENQPLLVQNRESNMVDLHDFYSSEMEATGRTKDSFFGIPLNQKTVNIGENKAMSLSESYLTLGNSVFTPKIGETKITFEPEAHRMKDKSRLVGLGKEITTISGKNQGDISFLEQRYAPFKVGEGTPAPADTYVSPSYKPRIVAFSGGGGVIKVSSPSSTSFSPSFSPSISPSSSSIFSPSPSPSSSIFSPSPSPRSPSFSPSKSISTSPSFSPSLSPSMSPSLSPSISASPSPSPSISFYNYYPEIPGFPLIFPPFGGGIWKGFNFPGGIGGSNKRGYQPSLTGALFNLKTPNLKHKRMFTGMEIRGM